MALKTKILQLFSFILFLFIGNVSAQDFIFSENCSLAYENIIALKLDSGQYYLEQEQTNNPDNLIPYLLANYIDFLEVYISNSSAVYATKKGRFEDRLHLLKSGNSTSPYFLFSQAEIHLHSAVLHIKFGEYIKAVFDVKKALKQLKENQQKFPDFLATKKSLGTLYAILGSVPDQYKTGMQLLGLKGNVKGGMAMLQSLLDEDFEFQHEAATVYAFLQLHISNQPVEAWNTLQNYNFSPTTSVMDAYTVGHIGIHGNYTDKGLDALLQRPISSDYSAFPYLDFLIGLGKTYRQDEDANMYFSQFLMQNKGQDYVKSAYHKMAWNELIKGNDEKYKEYRSKIGDYGRTTLDTDKQAEREYESGKSPHPNLLKARLMADGNYLTSSKRILEGLTINDFEKKEEKTEYYYRLGRTYDKIGETENAKNFYRLTISNGRAIPYYYSANAAYLLGYIYELEGDLLTAKKYYDMSLDLDGYEYKNSIHLKAKSGIARLVN